MLALRCFHQSLFFLQQCQIIIRNLSWRILPLPSCSNLCSKPLTCVRNSKSANINLYSSSSMYSRHIIFDDNCSRLKPSQEKCDLNKRIRLLQTVEELLKLHEKEKNSVDLVHRVTMLYRIAKIVEKYPDQLLELEKERENYRQGKVSSYMLLLESLEKSISRCRPHGLANILWALGKVHERDHKLVKICEKKILSCNMKIFSNAGLCQIVHGCASLNMTSEIFEKLEQEIVNGELAVFAFDNVLLSAVLLTFSKTKHGSVQLFDILLEEILSRDFFRFDSRALASFVWAFAKKELNKKKLYDRVEEEIFRRGTADLHNADFIQLIWAVSKAEMGSKEFLAFLDTELELREIKGFSNVQLVEIVWSFAKSKMAEARVFDVVKAEIFRRGVDEFQTHELVVILWSFVSVQRHNERLIADIEGKLCTTDVKKFDNGDLCQIVWSLAKAGWHDSKLFDAVEAEVIQRGTSQLSIKEKCMIIRSFLEAKRGRTQLYELLVVSFSTCNLGNLHEGQILECLRCLFMSGVEVQGLFETFEKELLSKGNYGLNHDKGIYLRTRH